MNSIHHLPLHTISVVANSRVHRANWPEREAMRAIQQFRTFNRPVQLLLINQFAIMIGFSMLMPYLTGYLTTTLGFAAWVAGLVLGLRTFSQQGLSVIGGTLADHVGYKLVIARGCILRMAGFLLFAFSDVLSSVLLAALLSWARWRALRPSGAGVSRLGVGRAACGSVCPVPDLRRDGSLSGSCARGGTLPDRLSTGLRHGQRDLPRVDDPAALLPATPRGSEDIRTIGLSGPSGKRFWPTARLWSLRWGWWHT